MPWSTPVLSWLLGASRGKSATWNLSPGGGPSRSEDQHRPVCHTHALTHLSPMRGGGEITGPWGCWPVPPGSLGAAMMPAVAKAIHGKGPTQLQYANKRKTDPVRRTVVLLDGTCPLQSSSLSTQAVSTGLSTKTLEGP
jgi:hypothetical protein